MFIDDERLTASIAYRLKVRKLQPRGLAAVSLALDTDETTLVTNKDVGDTDIAES